MGVGHTRGGALAPDPKGYTQMMITRRLYFFDQCTEVFPVFPLGGRRLPGICEHSLKWRMEYDSSVCSSLQSKGQLFSGCDQDGLPKGVKAKTLV